MTPTRTEILREVAAMPALPRGDSRISVGDVVLPMFWNGYCAFVRTPSEVFTFTTVEIAAAISRFNWSNHG